jgi:hypothetical protein
LEIKRRHTTMNSKLVTRLSRVEQRSSLQRASFGQEMLSKALGRLNSQSGQARRTICRAYARRKISIRATQGVV